MKRWLHRCKLKRSMQEYERLTSAQRAAWRHVEETVRSRQAAASVRLTNIVRAAGCAQAMLDAAMEGVRDHARVVVHFHPDRIGPKSITVAEDLLRGGEYLSQFVTGLSSGSRTAYPGGLRDTWERTLFGGAYHTLDSSNGGRPKYGALELIRYPDGPWPRCQGRSKTRPPGRSKTRPLWERGRVCFVGSAGVAGAEACAAVRRRV